MDADRQRGAERRLLAAVAHAPLVPEWTLDVFARGGSGDLRPRERQVLQAAAAGMGNGETAAILGIGVETVKTHRRRLLAVLGAKNIAHAVAIGMRQGAIR